MKSNESGKQDNGGSLNLEDIQRLGFLDKDDQPDLLSEYDILWSSIENAGLSFSTNLNCPKRQDSFDLGKKLSKKNISKENGFQGSQPDLLLECERIWYLIEDSGLTLTPCLKKQKTKEYCYSIILNQI